MRCSLLLLLFIAPLLAPGCGPAGEAPEPATPSVQARPWPADRAGEDRVSVVALDDGEVWLAYQAYDGERDRIELGRLNDLEQPRLVVAPCPDHAHGTALAVDGSGRLHVVWSERGAEGFVLRERLYSPGELPGTLTPVGEATLLRARPGANLLDPLLASGPAGELLLVYSRVEGPSLGVQASAWSADGGWGEPIDVHLDDFSNWAPAVTAWGPGRFAVVWDSAVDGDYDVLLAELRVDDGVPRVVARRRITDTPSFEAHASVAAAGERLYVAYEVSPEGWGREGSVNKLDEALHNVRTVEVLAVEGERVAPLAERFMAAMNANLEHNCEKPALHVDGSGSLLIAFRGMPLPTDLQDPDSKQFRAFVEERAGGGVGWRTSIWYSYVSRYNGRVWSFRGHHHDGVPGSEGRSDAPFAFAPLPRGGAVLAVVGDGREFEPDDSVSWWRPVSTKPNRVAGQRIAKAETAPNMVLGEWSDLPAWRDPSPRDVAPRPPRTLADGREVRLALGDLHRHTDLSRCSSNWDGPFTDAARYAFDVGRLQFLAVTDHFEHMTGFEWWRNLGEMEAWHAPGRMVDLRAYERADAVVGHRNVISGDGELPLIGYRNQFHPPRDAGKADDTAALWPFFDQLPVITIPHTPAGMFAGNPTVFDWLSFEPSRDRLVEIFQGYRGSSEVAGGPLAIDVPHAPRFVRAAFDGGLHFGVIASSDHQSSYGSFAGVWATELTREGVFAALEERRTFASTAPMALWLEWNGVPMGTYAQRPAGPAGAITIEVDAFDRELDLVELIVDGRTLRTAELSGHADQRRFETVELAVPDEGSTYAYARVRTTDGEYGWTSPVRLGASLPFGSDGPPGRKGYGPRVGRMLEVAPATGDRDPSWARWEGGVKVPAITQPDDDR